jgi:hypothetical protein
MIGRCVECGKDTYVMPLHGEDGGPLFCPFCAGQWYGAHGKKMKWRRILMKSMAGYEEAGGNLSKDLDKMKGALAVMSLGVESRLPGYSTDHIPNTCPDITSELLTDTLQLVHPDKHPLERRELARRVTQELLALKPYVFPAPTPEPPPVYQARDASFKKHRAEKNEPSKPAYPCDLCEDTVPRNYCNSCRAEWDKRQEEEREREDKKRIARNARARRRYSWSKRKPGLTRCSHCDVEFRAKRQGAKYCSASCRQKAYLARDGKLSNTRPLNRVEIRQAIESIFDAERDWAFTTEELCERALAVTNPERKHRSAVLAACRLAGLGIFGSETRGQERLVFRLDSLMGYAVARKRCWLWDDAERIKAELAPGGESHHLIEEDEDGTWVRHWRMFVAEERGETDTPLYRRLENEQREAWGI